MSFLSNLFGQRKRRERVVFDEHGVLRTMSNGSTESVTWEELREVAIVTTGEGPFADDVYWVLSASDAGCAVPSGADGMNELLPRLQALQGFDNQVVVEAMGSTSDAKFVCWKR
jgi:hypothetical protein